MTQKEKMEQAYVLMCRAEEVESELRQIRWQRREQAKQDAIYADNRKALKEQREEKMKTKGMVLGGAAAIAVLAVLCAIAAANAGKNQMNAMYLTMGAMALLAVGPITGKQMMEKRIEKLRAAEKAEERSEQARKEAELQQLVDQAKAFRAEAQSFLPADAPKTCASSKAVKALMEEMGLL